MARFSTINRFDRFLLEEKCLGGILGWIKIRVIFEFFLNKIELLF